MGRCGHQVKTARPTLGLRQSRFRPVHAVRSDGPGKFGVGSDQQNEVASCRHARQLASGFDPVGCAEMPVDDPPAFRQPVGKIDGGNAPVGIGKDKHGRPAGRKLVAGYARGMS